MKTLIALSSILVVLAFLLGYFIAPLPVDVSPTPRVKDFSLSDKTFQFEGEDLAWAEVADTNSMVPTIDAGTKVIFTKRFAVEELRVGDIISYRRGERNILHRIVEIGYDSEGWYAVTKGDNARLPDLGKVREGDITKVVIAVIY